MGNRAIIATKESYRTNGAGIYLHWNGGRDSVEAFLTYARLKGCRGGDYGIARLTQYIGNFFGGTNSLGIVPAQCGAGDDNGVYIIDDKFNIIDREEIGEGFTEQQEYDLAEMVTAINEAQPHNEQIPERLLHQMIMAEQYPMAWEEKISLVRVGQVLFTADWTGTWSENKVAGIGQPGQVVNGHDVEGIPYIDKYGNEPETNPNNYLFDNKTFYFA